MRNDDRIKRNRKEFLLVSIVIIFVMAIVLGILLKMNILGNSIAEAVNVNETLNIINANNPIKNALNDEIEMHKIKRAELYVKSQKKIISDRILEEERLEAERIAEIRASGKVAYLTFDDGPSVVVTDQIMDILDSYNIKATFFVIGYMAERHPEIVKRVYENGHSIGNHTYSHNYGYIYRNSRNFLNDIDKSNKTLKNILGEEFSTDIIRFPGGSFGANKAPMKYAVKKAGYKYFDWNSLNGDAEGVDLSVDQLIKRFKDTSKNKKELVVLMHDTDQKQSTADSLEYIIEYLLDNGYIFDVLDNYE